MPENERPVASGWSRFGESVGVALWTSFITACFETLIVFAFFDPVTLGLDGVAPSVLAMRPILYAFGFFFFWFFAFLGTALTAHLLASGPNAASADRSEQS
jgi:hypothetical protein